MTNEEKDLLIAYLVDAGDIHPDGDVEAQFLEWHQVWEQVVSGEAHYKAVLEAARVRKRSFDHGYQAGCSAMVGGHSRCQTTRASATTGEPCGCYAEGHAAGMAQANTERQREALGDIARLRRIWTTSTRRPQRRRESGCSRFLYEGHFDTIRQGSMTVDGVRWVVSFRHPDGGSPNEPDFPQVDSGILTGKPPDPRETCKTAGPRALRRKCVHSLRRLRKLPSIFGVSETPAEVIRGGPALYSTSPSQ